MPERLAYDEAMQFSAIRLKIQDPELKQGKVEMLSAKTTMGTIDRPWGIEGGFAVVYKFRKKRGTLCALRCFRVPMKPDTQFRYERIGPYFHAYARDITAGFKYYDAAILVKEQGKAQGQPYPVIEMDWIDGVTLVEKVDELCQKRQRATLKALAEQWITLLSIMQRAQIAHGDLAGVNVMVRGNGRMVLIDYDGTYIPEFAGLTPVLVGQEDFQHPQMAQRQFHEHIDAFSALVIYIALSALAIKPELWDTYAKFDPNGKLIDVNLLFRKQDFQDPQQSPLIQELEHLGDPHIHTIVQELKHACLQPINDVRFPFALVDPHYNNKQAFARLTNALQTNDDEQIAACWLPILENYPPAQRHRSRVQLAQRRLGALHTFRNALATGDLQRILDSYDVAQLDASGSISSEERLLLSLARTFLQSYSAKNDDIVDIADQIAQDIKSVQVIFTPQQQQLLTQMRQHKTARQAILAALQSRDIAQIAAAYPFLHYATTPTERQRIELASTFMQAYTASDDNAFLAAYANLQQDPGFFILTADQQQRATLIEKRAEALQQFRAALTSKSPWQVVKAYDAVLDNSTRVTPTNRELLALARQLTTALRSGDYNQLLAAENALQQSPHHTFFLLTHEEKQRFALAHEQQKAALAFHTALQSKRPADIVAAYTTYAPTLNTGHLLAQEEIEKLALARLFVDAFHDDDDEALLAVYEELQQPATYNLFLVTAAEQQRFVLAQQRFQALHILRQAIYTTPGDAQKIMAAYDASLLATGSILPAEERELVTAAINYLAMYKAVKDGLQANNDDLIRHAFDPALAQRFAGFTPDEQQRIDKAMIAQTLENLLDSEAYEQAIQMAWSLQQATGYVIGPSLIFKLKRATLRFVRQHDLSQLFVQIDEYNNTNYATVSWQWPANQLIRVGLLVWDTRTWPERPSEKRLNDPGWRYIWVRRKNNVLYDRHTFSIGKETRVYIKSYAAVLDAWDRDEKWRFSDGREPTSYGEANGPHGPQMIRRIQ